MENQKSTKWTTITIDKETAKEIRLIGINDGIRTGQVITRLLQSYKREKEIQKLDEMLKEAEDLF
jgi:hypothetical protein